MIKKPILLLLFCALMPVKAETLHDVFSRVTELYLPAQLYACKLHYPDMQINADDYLNRIGYEKDNTPEQLLKRNTIQVCLQKSAVLTHADCVQLFNNLNAVIQQRSDAADNAIRYIKLSQRTLPQFDQIMDNCPEAQKNYPKVK